MVKKRSDNIKNHSSLLNFYICCNKWKLPKTEQFSSITFPVIFEAFMVVSGMLLIYLLQTVKGLIWNPAHMAAKQTSFIKIHSFISSSRAGRDWKGFLKIFWKSLIWLRMEISHIVACFVITRRFYNRNAKGIYETRSFSVCLSFSFMIGITLDL